MHSPRDADAHPYDCDFTPDPILAFPDAGDYLTAHVNVQATVRSSVSLWAGCSIEVKVGSEEMPLTTVARWPDIGGSWLEHKENGTVAYVNFNADVGSPLKGDLPRSCCEFVVSVTCGLSQSEGRSAHAIMTAHRNQQNRHNKALRKQDSSHLLRSRLHLAREKTSDLAKVMAWVASFPSSEDREFSQNGEDGVIRHLLRMVPPKAKYYVELGVEDGSTCNTRALHVQGWTGLLVDSGYENPKINLVRSMIWQDNVVSILRNANVPAEFDLLAIGTDCYDFWLLQELLAAGYRPRILVNEVNAAIANAPPRVASVPPGSSADEYCSMTQWFGASVSAFYHLYRRYGYSMVYCEARGVNCFGVRDDVLGLDQPLSTFLTDVMVYRPAKYGNVLTGSCGSHPAISGRELPNPLERTDWSHYTPTNGPESICRHANRADKVWVPDACE